MEATIPGSAQIGNLAVNLSLETAAFQRGATQAEARARTLQTRLGGISKSIASFGTGLLAGIGVSAIAGLAGNAFQLASALDESAQKMGVSVEALQELNFAAEQSGVSQEALAGAMNRLNKSVGQLAQGSKPAVEAFAKIGLSFDDLKGKSPDQQLRIIADALNRLPSVQERIAVGSQLMGRGFNQLLPLINGGSAALDKYAETSRKSGEITTEEAKRLDELADTWERVKVKVGVFTAKAIASIAQLSGTLDTSLNKWYTWRDGVIGAAQSLTTSVAASLANLVSAVKTWMVDKLNAIWDGVKAKIESVKQKFHDLYDSVVGHSYVPDMIDGIARSMAELQRIMVDPALSATEKVGAAFQSLAGLMGSLFGHKAGSIIGAIGNLVTALAPIFGGKPTLGAIDESGAVGMARGGSGVFGGRPGVDRNVLSLNGSPIARVSKGERFSVGANENAQMQRVMIVPSPYFDAVVDRRASNVAAPFAGQAAVMGASGGVAAIQHRAARRLP